MNFLDIPEEVIAGTICSYLKQNEVLRLRLVSNQIKCYADKHLKVRLAEHEFEINEKDKTFQHFMILDVCATRFYFNFKMAVTDCQPDINEFMGKYADKITHLRVAHFHAFSQKMEMNFYGALSKLKHLELEEVDAMKRDYSMFTDNAGNHIESLFPFPDNFKELETLKFGTIQCSSGAHYQWDLFKFCEKLVNFKHGMYAFCFSNRSVDPNGMFLIVPQAIRDRKQKFPNGPHFKYFDIGNARDNDIIRNPRMINLLQVCVEHDVKLLNVNAPALESVNGHAEDAPVTNLGKPIMSLHANDLTTEVFCIEMPNLEKLSISDVHVEVCEHEFDCYPAWPKLKCLDICVACWKDDYSALLKFLFEREPDPLREQLTELNLRFTHHRPVNEVEYPSAKSIIATCPNLTKLTLANHPDPVPNKEYLKLWKGLQFLQELVIEECQLLGNAGFIGDNVNEPTFLELKRLKKFTLKGLDGMPQITDTFFEFVLRHMKIVQFVIQSGTALTSISQAGISSLLTGEFGESIEKFPFTGWSINGVSEEEFQLLGSKFRSSYML